MRYLSSLVLITLILSTNTLSAQSEPDQYLKISYHHFQDEAVMMIQLGLEQLKDSQQQRIDNGYINSWRLYEVLYSSNATHRYNYVIVEISDELNDEPAIELKEGFPELQIAIAALIKSTRVHSEIWGTRGKVYRDDSDEPSLYKNANFMTVQSDRFDDYFNLETDIAAPAHQYMTDHGYMNGWNFHQLIFPTGSAVKYNFITADFYSKLKQIEHGITPDIMMEVHPGFDMDEFEEYADTIRERVWSDLWKLILVVE